MNQFFLRPKAIDDLQSIWDYTVDTWGKSQAEIYLSLLDKTFKELARTPESGRKCDYILNGYRKFPAGKHVIFYRVINEDIEIVRILHQSMDVKRHL